MDEETLIHLRAQGFEVGAGFLGENITTLSLDLLSLPRDTKLHLGSAAVVQVTGLRNPCKQLDEFGQGLMQAVRETTPTEELIRKCGMMSVVISGREVKPGDPITVVLPDKPHYNLERV